MARTTLPAVRSTLDATRRDLLEMWVSALELGDMEAGARLVYAAHALRSAVAALDQEYVIAGR